MKPRRRYVHTLPLRTGKSCPPHALCAQVYEALSGLKNWGASTTLLNDIAADTFD